MKIEVDNEIYEYLRKKAIPFEDTPNTVLRRLLFGERPEAVSTVRSASIGIQTTRQKTVSDIFVSFLLKSEFGGGFSKTAGYRMMYESGTHRIYFQNFNKPSEKIWFRITENPLKLLAQTDKEGIICLTNPAERYAYILPVKDIMEQARRSGWTRDYLEVNIDVPSSRWIELNWRIDSYLHKYTEETERVNNG